MICPLCATSASYVVRTWQQVERESNLRAAFVHARLGHAPEGLEAMDLTQFMHGGRAEIVACEGCGLMLRKEDHSAEYAADRYDSALMRHLYPRYRNAFAQKRERYQPMLRPGAEVLEVGSHLGAFLEVAETWGWKPVGLDIGWDTSDFARRQGASVKRVSLDDYSSATKPDAVFIWNCFEQLDRPWDAMFRARRLLPRHGLVVVRVPNARFYRDRPLGGVRCCSALSYNNLLAFPYLNGYDVHALDRLLTSSEFEIIETFATSLLTPPYPDMDRRLRDEWRQIRADTEQDGPEHSPWIEIVGRAKA